MAGRIGLLLASAALVSGVAAASELRPDELKAWDDYISRADERVRTRAETGLPLLALDEIPQRAERLRQGEIVVFPLADHGFVSVPDGLIHDWYGAIFIPNTTIGDLLGILHDYDHYKNYYAPTVVNSKTLDCPAPEREFSMLWRRKVLFVDAALRAQYWARDFELSGRRGYTIAGTMRVQEIENYGRAGERMLPPGQGSGFIWRLHSIARYEERDGGVYVELEALALTRDVPGSLRWLVNPLVTRLSRSSVVTSLQQTRDAVTSRNPVVIGMR